MAEQIKFTQLPNVGDLTASAIIALAQAQGGDYASYSASLAQIAELLNKGISYEELPTEAKDILGAITEIYNSGGGGGGSNVKMKDNPNGGVDLTVDGLLRTLATQADLEEIAKHGGNYEEVVLYENPDGIEFKPNSPQTIQLPESYRNFHALYITASASNTPNYRDTKVIPTTSISVDDTYYINTYSVGVGYSFPTIRFTSENEIYLYGFDSDTPMKIYKVVGIKYGGGGGSSVAMSDNTEGGVDISVEGETKTLATQKDLDTLYKITQGQSWDFVDQQESGTNLAPKGTERQSLISVDGHSLQNTTTGKNLLSLINPNDSRIIINADGSININGSFGNTTVFIIGNVSGLTGQALTISGCVGGSSTKYKLQAWYSDTSTSPAQDFGNGATFTPDRDFVVRLVIYTGTYNATIYPMIEKGSTATAYEPYTGGLPAPNPAYPQPITSVEQLNFKVTGRNLFNPNASGVQDGYLDTDGSVKTSSISQTSDFIDVRKLNSVYLTYLGTNTVQKNIGYYDSNKKFITYGNYTFSRSIDVTNYSYIRFTFVKADKDLVQLSTTSVTEIEPYREETHTIIPPFALNKIGDYADFASIESGEWVKKTDAVEILTSDWGSYGKDTDSIYAGYDKDVNNYLNDVTKVCVISDKLTGKTYNARHSNKQMARIYMGRSNNTIWCGIDPNANINSLAELTAYLGNMKCLFMLSKPTQTPIEADDLEYLKSLQNLDSNNVITITDQNGNDISYLMKYLVKLSEAI